MAKLEELHCKTFDRIVERYLNNKLVETFISIEAGSTEYRTTIKIIEYLWDLGISVLFAPNIYNDEATISYLSFKKQWLT